MKKIIFLLYIITLSLYLPAQDIKTVFVNMPDSITPLLTAVNRADFVDFMESNMKAEVKNKFDDTAEMTELTDSYTNIRMTEESTWQMKLLPLPDDSQVICLVTTACAPVCDSNIRFFNMEWKELPASDFINIPQEKDFYHSIITGEQSYEYSLLREKADLYLYRAELSPDSQQISFTYTTPEYLNTEDRTNLMPYVTSQIVMLWKGGRFSPENI